MLVSGQNYEQSQPGFAGTRVLYTVIRESMDYPTPKLLKFTDALQDTFDARITEDGRGFVRRNNRKAVDYTRRDGMGVDVAVSARQTSFGQPDVYIKVTGRDSIKEYPVTKQQMKAVIDDAKKADPEYVFVKIINYTVDNFRQEFIKENSLSAKVKRGIGKFLDNIWPFGKKKVA